MDNNTRKFKIETRTELIHKQGEFFYYRDCEDFGFSGGPLLKLKEQNENVVNAGEIDSLVVVGLHRGKHGLHSQGISFNTFENTREIVSQLV